jgi:hypothetical protein
MATLRIRIPFNLERDELVQDPATSPHDHWHSELEWLEANADADEVVRILTSAVLLSAHTDDPIGQCLHTAIIWERG